MSLLIKNGTVRVLKGYSWLLGLFISTFVIGCGLHNGDWSEERRNEFEAECSKTDTFSSMVIALRGFENSEFDSIRVREFDGDLLVDSFGMKVDRMHDKLRKERLASIHRKMNVKHTYRFLVPGQEPFILADMKMVMWAQYTMGGEGWGCVMGDYTLDSVRYEHNANPTLVKRNWNFEL
ncbi:MAG: hypothetical protein JNM62_01715 [Flavobacteriales bacterium]|nr:hypothetical protein [Flavobacteriales bacterium]